MSGKHLIEFPTKADGAALWRIARDSQKLDLNTPYAYLLWCRDFADTSVVAKVDGQPVGRSGAVGKSRVMSPPAPTDAARTPLSVP